MRGEIEKTSMVCGEISFLCNIFNWRAFVFPIYFTLSCTVLPIQFFGKIQNKKKAQTTDVHVML